MDANKKEALKEVARYLVFFAIGWVISETLKQINVVPENYYLHIWEFIYAIPVRAIVNLGLTLALRYTDKYMHLRNKEKGYMPKVDGSAPSMGLLRF